MSVCRHNFLLDFDTGMTKIRAAPIPGIGIGSIPAFFDGIRIGQVRYTSTNFCCLCIIIHKIAFFQKSSSKITKKNLILTTHSLEFNLAYFRAF